MDYTITRADLNNCQFENCTAYVQNENHIEAFAPDVMLTVIYNVLHKEAVSND
ncbi:MAG: hypothetical protein IJZ61_04385 [Oscillospiraceae bacterium]|nr:hypothetical protein [Oscillospiraceae bacterium]